MPKPPTNGVVSSPEFPTVLLKRVPAASVPVVAVSMIAKKDSSAQTGTPVFVLSPTATVMVIVSPAPRLLQATDVNWLTLAPAMSETA